MRRTTKKTRWALLLGLTTAMCCVDSPALAETEAEVREQAAEHFRVGNVAFREKRWEDAEKAYQQAWDLARSFDVAGNFGEVKLRLAKYTEAAMLLSFNLRTAPPSAKPDQLERTRHFLDEASGYIGTLRITVDPPNAVVKVDGERLTTDGNEPMFVEPGPHTIEATREGYQKVTTVLDVKAGSAIEQHLSLPEKKSRLPLVGFAGGAVIAAGVGAGFLLVGKTRSDEADNLLFDLQQTQGREVVCPAQGATGTCADIQSLRAMRDTFVDVGVGAFVASGVLLAGGVVFALWPEPNKTRTLALSPMTTPERQGIWLSGSF